MQNDQEAVLGICKWQGKKLKLFNFCLSGSSNKHIASGKNKQNIYSNQILFYYYRRLRLSEMLEHSFMFSDSTMLVLYF